MRLEERLRKAVVKQNLSERTRVVIRSSDTSQNGANASTASHAQAVLAFALDGEGQLPVSLLLGQTANDG
jgi:hypothetical protein